MENLIMAHKLHLASDRSSYVSGSVMLVDGGITHAFT